MTDTIQLSDEQETAAKKFEEWLDLPAQEKRRPFFVLEGYAGTGKSFCVNEMIRRTGLKPQYMAYTGKAALVLNKYSNVNATTIHSAIYKLRQVPDETFKKLFEQMEAADGDKKRELEIQIEKLQQPSFELDVEAFDDSNVDLLVLDECSMVDQEVLADLTSFNIPIIALGDPGQLPPVKGEGALFSGLPDAQLREIRRQALDSPIIKWSMWAREKRPLPMTPIEEWENLEVAKIPYSMTDDALRLDLAAKHDIIICWRNVTRQRLNQWQRKANGLFYKDPVYPVVGDTLIITRNDRELGIFNGQFAEVLDIKREFDNYIEYEVKAEGIEEPFVLKTHRLTFELYADKDAKQKYRPWDFRGTHEADFGYAITCHKAQGSQWERVLIFEENVLNWPAKYDERAQWLYTAITRAVKKVTIVAGKF